MTHPAPPAASPGGSAPKPLVLTEGRRCDLSPGAWGRWVPQGWRRLLRGCADDQQQQQQQ